MSTNEKDLYHQLYLAYKDCHAGLPAHLCQKNAYEIWKKAEEKLKNKEKFVQHINYVIRELNVKATKRKAKRFIYLTQYSILLKKENAHDDPIYTCAWAKTNTTGDSKGNLKDFVVTGGLDSLVKVWKFEGNKLELLHVLKGHAMAVVSVAVSSDGHTIASTSQDSSLIIWDLLSGQKVHEIKTGATDVWSVAFSPEGSQIVSGGHTGKIYVYGILKGTTDRVLDTRGKFALTVAWSADNKYIASGAVDGTVCIFDVAQGKLLHTIEDHAKTVRSVAFSPNSTLLVTASDDGKVKVYNVASANLQSSLNYKTWVLSALFSPDGTRVAAAAADGSVRVASVDGLKLLYTFQEHTAAVCSLQFNPIGDKLISVSKDQSLNVYECPLPPKKK